jgi:hypothetical protein
MTDTRHAVNLGERVGSMVTGWMPEHAGPARVLARHTVADVDGSSP